MTLEARFSTAMTRLLADLTPQKIGVSVSGGGDSTALMYLAADWAKRSTVTVHVASIDHGLREGSDREVALVAQQASDLGLPHSVLQWRGWDGHGNLQQAARNARHALLDHWRGDIGHILLGHTMDDQAETFGLNLARGSGVAGLAAMAPRVALHVAEPDQQNGFPTPSPGTSSKSRCVLLRPLLDERRSDLRDWLRENGITWSDDPSNEDERFDRVRVRAALAGENALGLTVEGLAATAKRMQRARAALEHRAAAVFRNVARTSHGDVLFDRDALADLEPETRFTLVAHALQWVSSAPYRPRAEALEGTLEAVLAGRAATLHGCLLTAQASGVRITREEKAVSDLEVPLDRTSRWDRRWVISGPPIEGGVVRPLGQRGLTQLDKMPSEDLPRASLAAYPALYVGQDVVALPGLLPGKWHAELCPPRGDILQSLQSG